MSLEREHHDWLLNWWMAGRVLRVWGPGMNTKPTGWELSFAGVGLRTTDRVRVAVVGWGWDEVHPVRPWPRFTRRADVEYGWTLSCCGLYLTVRSAAPAARAGSATAWQEPPPPGPRPTWREWETAGGMFGACDFCGVLDEVRWCRGWTRCDACGEVCGPDGVLV